jgi:hypothetical protein
MKSKRLLLPPPFLNLCPLAIAALNLGLCGYATTSRQQTWKAPTSPGGPVQKIAGLAVGERAQFRRSVESHLNVQLNQHGQSAFVTHDLLALPAIPADKEAAAAKLRAA